jgi:aryl-alcohol dehydrogenase-like predicted oxidoreductase
VSLRRIGPFDVAPIGLGCMNLSHAYGEPPSPEAAERLLLGALDLGVTLFDTAALYGFGINETLVGRVLGPHRSRIVLASKGGMGGVTFPDGVVRRVIDGRPESIRRNCEDSLRRLGTDVIDLYYLHRWDKSVPIEDSVGELVRLLEAGKVRALGLSEVSAATLRRAHAVHPIAAVQSEYSLWTRNPEIAVLQACRELGVAFVAFSPVARGYFAETPLDTSALQPGDLRRTNPRFVGQTWARNLERLVQFRAIVRDAGCGPAGFALAWLLSRGPDVIPIPGTTSLAHLRENVSAATLRIAPDLFEAAQALFPPADVCGPRYPAQSQAEVDTEQYATPAGA